MSSPHWALVGLLAVIQEFSLRFTDSSCFFPSFESKLILITTGALCALWTDVFGLFLAGISYFLLDFSPTRGGRSRSNPEAFDVLSTDIRGASLIKKKFDHIYKHIMSDSDSSRIAIFLTINFSFMFVELFVGFMSNSLGLISDAIHMLFDCLALAIGLYASYMSTLKPNERFTFGYLRYETLAGLVNAIFLIFISFEVLVESLDVRVVCSVLILPAIFQST